MSKTKEYQARAAEALVDLDNATNERDRARVRRSHGVWLRLIANVDEAAARVAARTPPKVKAAKAGLFK